MVLELPPELPISSEDWARSPPFVQAVLLVLWKDVQILRTKVRELEERLDQSSQNSSLPPSTDPPHIPKPRRKPSGRNPGGQPGHKSAGRPLLPTGEVDAVVEVKPEVCGGCGSDLEGHNPQLLRHQVTELPPVVPTVTEPTSRSRKRLTAPGAGVCPS